MAVAVIASEPARSRICMPPYIESESVIVVNPGAFANRHCDTIDLTNSAPFLIIAAHAFANVTGVTNVFIPENTRLVDDHAFANSSVISITLLHNSTIVGPLAFPDLVYVAVTCPSYDICVKIPDNRWHQMLQGLVKCDLIWPGMQPNDDIFFQQFRSDPRFNTNV